jgi:hypothetical protein
MEIGQVLEPVSVFKTLTELLDGAKSEVVIVSPFITFDLLQKLLSGVNSGVKVTVVTRFRPEEIVKNLNSLKVFDLLVGRDNGHLRLAYHLHAKYYRIDSQVIFGSGNLTNKGLNTYAGGNHEIMVKLDSQFPGVGSFENRIFGNSTMPTASLIADLQRCVDELALSNLTPLIPKIQSNGPAALEGVGWIPCCESPSSIFNVYNNELAEIDKIVVEDARSDLEYLSIPVGLSRDYFNKYVKIAIHQSSLISIIDNGLDIDQGITPKIGIELIGKSLNLNRVEAATAWYCAINWLAYFFPEKYGIRTY